MQQVTSLLAGHRVTSGYSGPLAHAPPERLKCQHACVALELSCSALPIIGDGLLMQFWRLCSSWALCLRLHIQGAPKPPIHAGTSDVREGMHTNGADTPEVTLSATCEVEDAMVALMHATCG